MFKLPVYSPSNYQNIIWKPFSPDACQWLDISDFLEILSDTTISLLQDANVMKLSEFVKNNTQKISQIPAGKFWSSENAFYALKYLMPTLWTCEYFIWNVGKWKHHWIDIMLPLWTPLVSLCEWEVVKAKKWDWIKKDDWNCVVIKSSDWKYFCYEHMDTIWVEVWAKLKVGDSIWTCWKTWNSTQFHLHLQVDSWTAPFHPYWSANQADILKYTIDPILTLRTGFWKDWVSDKSSSIWWGDLLDDVSKAIWI